MPRWKAKAVAQQMFSRLPAGSRMNYAFQRHVTHGLPISSDELRAAVDTASAHVEGLRAHSTIPIEAGRFFEFGAGWDLHIAQALWCLGVNRQLLVDIRPLLRPELVFD